MQRVHRERVRAGLACAGGGFTLIELLLVLVILAVLAAVMVPIIAQRPDQARAAATKADLSQLETALDAFMLDNGRYPSTAEGLNALVQMPPDLQETWKGRYIKEVTTDKWGHAYIYAYPAPDDQTTYQLFSVGKDGQEGTADDISRFQQ